MTYRCGIGDGMARLGMVPGPPHIFCDVCGLKLEAVATRGGAPAWLRKGTAPKGWGMARLPDGTRRDFCPRHKSAVNESEGQG